MSESKEPEIKAGEITGDIKSSIPADQVYEHLEADPPWKQADQNYKKLLEQAERLRKDGGDEEEARLHRIDAAIAAEEAYELATDPRYKNNRENFGFNAAVEYFKSGQRTDAFRMSTAVLGEKDSKSNPARIILLTEIQRQTTPDTK